MSLIRIRGRCRWPCSTRGLPAYLVRMSAHLRFCRQIVAEAWLDIKIRLPKPSPSKVAELIITFDGREEGSEHPNFMLASERYSYGI
jgi:hypothetical protein